MESGKPFPGDSGGPLPYRGRRVDLVLRAGSTERYREWTAGEFVSPTQSEVEPILIADARVHGAEHRFNTQMTSVRDGSEWVDAVIEDIATGRLRRVRADYFIAADGHRSPVREQLGIARPARG